MDDIYNREACKNVLGVDDNLLDEVIELSERFDSMRHVDRGDSLPYLIEAIKKTDGSHLSETEYLRKKFALDLTLAISE